MHYKTNQEKIFNYYSGKIQEEKIVKLCTELDNQQSVCKNLPKKLKQAP